ncbi:TIGR03067 domain-containing protein [Niabella sp. 22666]|uniref:TIGR03067 domain-containing protein n=1 Tax=Niabella sp. 22666 TaxID=3453954 RepID=UPI003F85812F
MKIYLIILLVVCALSCSVSRDAAKHTDQANLQGAWVAQSESQNGKTWNVSYLYVFKGDKLFFTDETGKEVTYSFRLDTTGSLRFIVVQPDETLNISAPVNIAYELNGDLLKIVIAPAGLRPTEISDKNNQELIICKRKGS